MSSSSHALALLHARSDGSMSRRPFRSRSIRICTFSRSLRIGDEGACAAGHLGWVRRSRLAACSSALAHVLHAKQLQLPVLVAVGSAAEDLEEQSQRDVLGMDLAPCGEVGRIPTQVVHMPCAEVAALDTATCLDSVVDVGSSTVDKSGSAVARWKGLWELRCQISLHLRLMHDVQNLHQLSGTQTDLMVVPCFLRHLAGAVFDDTEDNAPRSRLEIVQMAVQHRSQTAACWCWQIAGRSVECRSRQMIALFDISLRK